MIGPAYVEPPTAPDHDAQPVAPGEDGRVSDFEIRAASVADVPDLIRLVQELAAYEKEPDAATATPDQFREALFPAQGDPTAYALVGVREGAVVAMAIWFRSFSTWTGQAGIWLEDLFVEPEQRGHGLGKALLARLAQLCVERGWTRLEWSVLDWNTPSIDFYRAHGARSLDDWTTFRVDGDALPRLAADEVRRPPRRMGSADVLWLNMDRPTNLMVIVSVVLLESVPDWDRVLDAVARPGSSSRTPSSASAPSRPRTRPRPLPLGGRPGLRPGAARAPSDPLRQGNRRRGRRRAAGLHRGAPAAPVRPVAPALGGPPRRRARVGAALVFRIHHALADGIALTRVLLGLTEDADGVPGDLVGPPATTDLPTMPLGAHASSGAIGSGLRLALASTRSGWDHLRSKGARAAVTDAAGLTLRTGQVVSDLLLTTNPASAVGGVPGQRKRVVWTQPLPLPGLKQVGRLVGATLNDVLMSAVAGALHAYQDEHGRAPVDLVTMVPVNVRPLDEPLPRELATASPSSSSASRAGTPRRSVDSRCPRPGWTGSRPPPRPRSPSPSSPPSAASPPRIERRVVDFFANKAIGVTTNVAGPRDLRHLAGVPVTGVLGWVPGSGRHTVGFCIVTYDDAVRIGIMADESVVPDPEALLAALEDEVALLVRIGAAGPTSPEAEASSVVGWRA